MTEDSRTTSERIRPIEADLAPRRFGRRDAQFLRVEQVACHARSLGKPIDYVRDEPRRAWRRNCRLYGRRSARDAGGVYLETAE